MSGALPSLAGRRIRYSRIVTLKVAAGLVEACRADRKADEPLGSRFVRAAS
jgi:hypothetical protein